MLLVPTACGRTNEPYAQELMMGAGDATLHVRIAGDPDAPNVLIAVHGGPGLSSSYMVSLEQLASQDFAVEQLTWSAVGEYDITTEVAKLDHPVLMLWGEDDPFGLPMAEATKTALSAAEVEFGAKQLLTSNYHLATRPKLQHQKSQNLFELAILSNGLHSPIMPDYRFLSYIA